MSTIKAGEKWPCLYARLLALGLLVTDHPPLGCHLLCSSFLSILQCYFYPEPRVQEVVYPLSAEWLPMSESRFCYFHAFLWSNEYSVRKAVLKIDFGGLARNALLKRCILSDEFKLTLMRTADLTAVSSTANKWAESEQPNRRERLRPAHRVLSRILVNVLEEEGQKGC